MARRPSEVADCSYLRAGGRDRCLNRADVRDMAAQAGKPRKGDKPGDDLDRKVVGGVTTALPRHVGHAPRAIESKADGCGIGRGCGGDNSVAVLVWRCRLATLAAVAQPIEQRIRNSATAITSRTIPYQYVSIGCSFSSMGLRQMLSYPPSY
jgi:hypothetical protein